MTTCYVFATEEHMGDIKNLILPVDATLYVDGLNPGEKTTCEQVAKRLHVFNKLKEHGVVMVICEQMLTPFRCGLCLFAGRSECPEHYLAWWNCDSLQWRMSWRHFVYR